MSRPLAQVPPQNARAIRKAVAAHQKAVAALDRATLELQVAAVDALDAGGSYRAVSETVGVARSTIQEWVRLVREMRS